MPSQLLMECYQDFLVGLQSEEEKHIMQEAINILTRCGPDEFMNELYARLPYPPKMVRRTIRNASNHKNSIMPINHIAELMDSTE